MATKALATTARPQLDELKTAAEHDLQEAERHASLAVVYAARAGGRFLAMKEIVESTRGYGAWGLWVSANVPLSQRSVNFYMQLARTLPELANPQADVAKVLEESAAARELASLSLRRAMQKLSDPKPPKALKAADEPADDEPKDPTPIVEAWVRRQLPLASQQDQDAIASTYLATRKEYPPDSALFELACELWAMGQRSAREGRQAVRKTTSSRTGRPPRSGQP